VIGRKMKFESELPKGNHDWEIDFDSERYCKAHCKNCNIKIKARPMYKPLGPWFMIDPTTEMHSISVLIEITERCEATEAPPMREDEFYAEWNSKTHLPVYEIWAKKLLEVHSENKQINERSWEKLAYSQWARDVRKTKYFNGEY
jgi:hypothetical protein